MKPAVRSEVQQEIGQSSLRESVRGMNLTGIVRDEMQKVDKEVAEKEKSCRKLVKEKSSLSMT